MLLALTTLTIGCGSSGAISPTAYGERAGNYFVQEFKNDSRISYANPESADIIAMYCADISSGKGTEMNWTLQEQLASLRACTSIITAKLLN